MNDAQGSSGFNETKYWTFFGDPSVNIRTAPPVDMPGSLDDFIIIGQDEFLVDVGEDGALVALSKDGVLLSSAYSVGGVSVLSLDENAVSVPGEIDIVVTGFNSIPYEYSVNVIAPEGAYIVVDDLTFNSFSPNENSVLFGEEIQMFLSVSNVGADGLQGLDFSCISDDPHMDLVDHTGSYESYIAPGGTVYVGPLNFIVNENVPDQHQLLMGCTFSGSGNTWYSDISLMAEAPVIVIDSVDGTLNPGETTTINVLVSNEGSTGISYPVVNVQGDMYANVNYSGIGNAYYWDHSEEYNQELLQIDVSLSSSTPIGHVVEFDVITTRLNGTLEHIVTFFMPVGQYIEDFENGFSQSLEWSFDGDAEWFIVYDEQNGGLYSDKSGDIGESQSTSISVTIDVVMDDSIDFYYKVVSEYSPS